MTFKVYYYNFVAYFLQVGNQLAEQTANFAAGFAQSDRLFYLLDILCIMFYVKIKPSVLKKALRSSEKDALFSARFPDIALLDRRRAILRKHQQNLKDQLNSLSKKSGHSS